MLLARAVTACLAVLSEPPSRISLYGDSECTISAMECTDCVLDTCFANRVAEVQEQLDAWRSQGLVVDKLKHWPGDSNPADIATKGRGRLPDILEDSLWQQGPPCESTSRKLACIPILHKASS